MPSDENNAGEKDDYEVGYCKPPTHSRYGPGQSGNLGGRPPKRHDLTRLLEAELQQKITITENGVSSTITKGQALLKTLVNDAIKKGKDRALIFKYCRSTTDKEKDSPEQLSHEEALQKLE